MFVRWHIPAALLLICAVPVFATPVQVGDSATLRLQIEQDGHSYTGTMTSEVIDFKHGETKPFLVRRNVSMNGQDKLEDVWLDAEDVGAEEEVQNLLSQCVSKEGTLESIQVPAGNIAVCTIPVKKDNQERLGTLSVGRVPFGLVRLEMKVNQNGQLRAELLSFRKN